MRRRQFLGTVSSAAAALAALSPRTAAVRGPHAKRPFRGWAWVHGGRDRTAEEWQRRFMRLREAGVAGALVGGGELDLMAERAQDAGLEFHRWIWTLNRSGDAWVQRHHPEWFTVSRRGDSSLDSPPYVGYYQWLCPTRESVREYLRDEVEAIARHPGVDGVHLDYVRHCDVILPVGLWSKYDLVQDREYPEFDFCYCEACREAFIAQSGTDPLALPDPPADLAWREFRWNSVTGLVRVLANAARAQGCALSAAVFPTPTIARRLVRQAWELWPLDAAFPMLYHAFYDEPLSWIGTATREGVGALPTGTPLYSGLYLPSLSPMELADAIREAREAGAAGVSVFEMDGLSDGHLEYFRNAMEA